MSHAGKALVFVRNPVTLDARVLREAETLRLSGFDTAIVGVVSTAETRTRSVEGGTSTIRLAPRSPLSALRERLRRRTVAGTKAGRAATPVANPPRPVIRLHRYLVSLDWYRRGIGVVLKERPQLVHCNDYNTMWIGVAARALGAAVIYDSHELWADRNGRREPRWWLIACEALFVRAASAVVTTSPGYAEALSRRYLVAAPRVIRNLPAAGAVAIAPRPGGTGDARNGAVLAYVGGLMRGRGLEQAIGILARDSRLRLRLLGPCAADYRAELEELAARLGVGDRIDFREPVAPGDVVSAISDADAGLALIQPLGRSYELTMPNKLFEYQAAGLPVLASDIPIVAGYVREHQIGEVVPPDDLDSIAAGVARLLEPRRNAECRQNARRLARSLTWESERKQLVDIYREAVTPGTP